MYTQCETCLYLNGLYPDYPKSPFCQVDSILISLTWTLWYSRSPVQLSKRLKTKSDLTAECWIIDNDLFSSGLKRSIFTSISNPNFCCQDFLRFHVMFEFCNLLPGLAFRHIPDLNRGFSRINVRKSGFRRIPDCINPSLVWITVRRLAIDHFIYKHVKISA